ncbi:MAG: AAA family ATPase [Nanoarchaeota archaeon]|nr:AAA family ATPase [Nanoarchaeota archaeon]
MVELNIESNAAPEKEDYVKIGVPGFDDLIEGGIPKGSSILVCGGPGSGKTTFCLHTLNYAANNGEKCLYLSFEESRERLIKHMKDYGFNPEELEEKGLLLIKRKNPFDISRSVEALLAKARGELLIEIDEVEELIPGGFKPDRIVFDSLSSISAAFIGRDEGYRVYIEQLFNALEKMNVTSFLISEVEQSINKYSKSGIEEFLADAIIAFYNIRKGNIRVSATEVIKVRGSAHKKKIVPFSMVRGKGIEIYPSEEVFTN